MLSLGSASAEHFSDLSFPCTLTQRQQPLDAVKIVLFPITMREATHLLTVVLGRSVLLIIIIVLAHSVSMSHTDVS